MPTNKCEICTAITDSSNVGREVWNTPLQENETFIVLPTLGPLAKGQTMIASKKHELNLLSMDVNERSDFNSLILYAETILGNNILFAEHGSFGDQTGGSCIEHTHVHVIPSFEKYFNILDTVLPIFQDKNDQEKVYVTEQIDFPYILTFNLKGGFRIYKAYNVHSQMIRKAICTAEGRRDWDWRQNNNVELIKKTIELWEKQ